MCKIKYRPFLAILLFLLLLVNYSAAAYPGDIEPATTDNIKKAIDYLSSVQNSDGGFPGDKGRPSSRIVTAWVIMALRAAGEDVNSGRWVKNGHSPVDYLKSGGNQLEATTDYARTLLALTAGEYGPVFKGIDLAEKIISFQQANGQFAQVDKGEEKLINTHMWSVLALASSDREIPLKEKAKGWLLSCQNSDGGFGWAVGGESDPDDTGVAITALVLLGEKPGSSKTIQRALTYLHSQEDEDGGFRWSGQKSNAASDAWVIQGLVAAGEDPSGVITHLLSFQNDDGSFNWTKDVKSSPGLMTAYAVMALAKKPVPVNLNFGELPTKELKISLVVDSKETLVNGRTKVLDVPPAVINDRTMVPLRFVEECLGAGFQWIGESQRVEITYDGKKFGLVVGQTAPGLDAPAVLVEGRVLVPVRYVSEKLGAKVTWLEKERRVEIER